MNKYYAIECTLVSGVKGYYCLYSLMNVYEVRIVRTKAEAIFYTQKELDYVKGFINLSTHSNNIKEYKIIKV